MSARHERGAAAVLAALLLLVLGGFFSLSFNVGHFMSVRAQLQNATDAGALAGARALDGTPPGIAHARLDAQTFAEAHATDKIPVSITGGDVILGHWNNALPKDLAFTPVADPATTPALVNAVLVRAGREESRGNALEVFFSAFLGQDTASATAEAVAIGGGPGSDCGAPLVFADCLVTNPDGSAKCGQTFVFADSTIDTIGFSNLTNGSGVNPPTVIDILNGDCGNVSVGDSVGVANGNNFNAAVIAAFQAYIDRNGPTIIAPIVSPGGCPNPQFNRIQPIVGFAEFTITNLKGAPHPSISVTMECSTSPTPKPAGGGAFGIVAQPTLAR